MGAGCAQAWLTAAYAKHPERFVRGEPSPAAPPNHQIALGKDGTCNASGVFRDTVKRLWLNRRRLIDLPDLLLIAGRRM
jgi:hypothetical protein